METQQIKADKFYCEEAGCGKSFYKKAHLRRHSLNRMCVGCSCEQRILTRPDNGQHAFICSECQKRFSRSDLHRRHMKRHERGLWSRQVVRVEATSVSIDDDQSKKLKTLRPHSYEGIKADEKSGSSALKGVIKEAPSAGSGTLKEKPVSSSLHYGEHLLDETSSIDPAHDILDADASDSRIVSALGEIEGLPLGLEDLGWLFNVAAPPLQEMINNESCTPSPLPQGGYDFKSLGIPSNLTEIVDRYDKPSDLRSITADSSDPSTEWDLISDRMLRYLTGKSDFDQINSPLEGAILAYDYATELIDSGFFAPAELKQHFYSYFANYHDHFPILHRPTALSSPSNIHPLLMTCIVTLGTAFSNDKHFSVSVTLHNKLRFLVLSHRDLIPPPLWILQSLVLIQAFEKMLASRNLHELASIFHGTVVLILKRAQVAAFNLEEPEASLHPGDEQSWMQWIERESLKRVVFFAFVMDAQHQVLFGHKPCLTATEILLELPVSDKVWDAKTYTEWAEVCGSCKDGRQEMFLNALKSVLHRKPLPANTSHFGRLIILHGLFNVSWQLEQKYMASIGIEEESGPADAYKSKIIKAIETWSYSLNSHQSMSIEVSKALHRLAYVNIYLLRTSLEDILLFSGFQPLDGRPLRKVDYLRANQTIKAWSATPDALVCCKHALMLIQETLFVGSHFYASQYYENRIGKYSAKYDILALRPWSLFICTLVVWTFFRVSNSITTLEVEHNEDLWVSCEEFLARAMQSISQATEDSNSGSYFSNIESALLASFIATVENCLRNTRWEMLDQASYCLRRFLRYQ